MDRHHDNRGRAVNHTETSAAGRPLMESGPVAGVNICVVGGGFVGLVAAAGFAEFGHSVVCVEKNREYLRMLQDGQVPFYERDLEGLIRKNLQRGRLSFAAEAAEAAENQQAIFVTVGTPSSPTGRAELTAIEELARQLAGRLTPDQVLVLKSTVPVGTGRRIQQMLNEGSPNGESAAVVNNPEFLREGSAVYDFFHPRRIVIGGESPDAVNLVTDIYRLGMRDPVPIVTTNSETAEMIKYASNAFLATKVGFINELACLCDRTGVNVMEVARGMGLDSRIGPEFLEPGPGWGGSCFRKDLQEFTGLAEAHDMSLIIARAVLEANRRQFDEVVQKVKRLVGDLQGTRIAVLGLSFKANTSDMRDSPAIPIVRKLLEAGAAVTAFDPQAHREAPRYLPEIELAEDAYRAAAGADCLLILTEWREFQVLDLKRIAEVMRQRKMVDARNIFVPELVQRYGFEYSSMGQR